MGFDKKRDGVEMNILENFHSHFKHVYELIKQVYELYNIFSFFPSFFAGFALSQEDGRWGGGEITNPKHPPF